MPFTPAHTALVLPLVNRTAFSATGLIVGSVAPDFEYFFKMGVNSEHSHTIAGLFYFDVPVAVVLSVVFHLFVKKNLLSNSPTFIQRRFHSLAALDFRDYLKRHYGKFLLSALIGAASHIFWDSFTHGGGYFAQRLWFYKGTYVPFDGVNYPLFYALQHISTAVGLSVLIAFILLKRPEPTARISNPRPAYWILFAFFSAAVFFVRFNFFSTDLDLVNGVVTFISAMCLAFTFCGFLPLHPVGKRAE